MKIHLDIRDDIPHAVALWCVLEVVKDGRVSDGGKSYCYATNFHTSDGMVWVVTRQYRKSDCFLVVKHKDEEGD